MAGDSFGLPFEGCWDVTDPQFIANVKRRAAHPSMWGYSDDTETTIGVAESIIRMGCVDALDLLRTLAANYDPARGYGKGMKLIFREVNERGVSSDLSQLAWEPGSKGNGAAVRVAPVALRHHRNDQSVIESASVSANITHSHEEAICGTLVQALAISFLLKSESLLIESKQLIDRLANHCENKTCVLTDKLRRIPELSATPRSRTEVIQVLGNGVLAAESVPLAIFVLQNSTSFEDGVVNAIRFGGDTDTIGAMVGTLLGALHGDVAIPVPWLNSLEDGAKGRHYLVGLADQLYELNQKQP